MDYTVSFKLTDGNKDSPGYEFKLSLVNTPPYFTSKIKSRHTVQFSKESFISIPSIVDFENNPYFFIKMKMPNFVRLD
jgi:hypothetical protein